MALFIRQNDDRSKLQERLAAELQERSKQRAAEADLPDGVEDSQFVKGTKQTSSFAWVWVIIALIAIGVTVWLTTLGSSR